MKTKIRIYSVLDSHPGFLVFLEHTISAISDANNILREVFIYTCNGLGLTHILIFSR